MCREGLSVVVGASIGEDRYQHLQVVDEVPDGLVERHAQVPLDHRLVGEPDSEHEAAVTEHGLRGECLTGKHRGVPWEGGDDGCSELDSRSGIGNGREDREGVDEAGLGQPPAGEAVLGGSRRMLLQAAHIGVHQFC